MKRILLAACIAGCVLGLGAQTVLAGSVKVPVNKISGEGVGEAGYDPEFDESSVAVSKRLPEVYRRIAHERGISFLAASAYAKPSEEDREHMNEEGHAALAEAVYAKLKEMLAGEKENAQIPA